MHDALCLLKVVCGTSCTGQNVVAIVAIGGSIRRTVVLVNTGGDLIAGRCDIER